MSDLFFIRKMKWLETIVTDRALSPLAVRAAVLIATRYLNNGSHTAWPGVATLAAHLATDRRSVQRALTQLVMTGLIDRQLNRGPSGRGGRSNLYKIAAFSDQGAAKCPPLSILLGGGRVRPGRGGKTPALTLEEPSNKKATLRRLRASGRRSDLGRMFPRRQHGPVSRREGIFGSKEAEVAADLSARWTAGRARDEFKKFKEWHDDNDTPEPRLVPQLGGLVQSRSGD